MTHAFDAAAPSNIVTMPVRQSLLDLEFSDEGRDPRFIPGWYILPSIVAGLALIVGALIYAL